MRTNENEINFNRILKDIFYGIFQIIFFIVSHNATLKIIKAYNPSFTGDINWGITVEYTFYVLIILVILQHGLFLFFERQKMIITILISVVFLVVSPPYSGEHPYRATDIAISGVLAFFIVFVLEYFVRIIAKNRK